MNQAPDDIQALWLNEARCLSEEFLSPVVVLGALADSEPFIEQPIGRMQVDAAWLSARQVALTSAVENSCLHREFRRASEKSGWIRIGWHEEASLAEGNGLLLAWSSPLPLMRIRNFSARCPSQLKIEGPGANLLAEEVRCHGICVAHWQIEVKYRPMANQTTAQILDGAALSKRLRAEFKVRADELALQGTRPGLAVILVGENPASQVYVRNKIKACHEAGMVSFDFPFPADVSPKLVFDKIAELNQDPAVHGILVQLPLPAQFDEAEVLAAIRPEKDVDGFHAANVGALMQGDPRFIPCTPYGVMKLLAETGVDLNGKEAVVIGRSNIVGKPMAMLLLHAGCTVTVCHSRTKDLNAHTRRADILVAAIGKPKFVTADMVKPGALVIDVGINRLPPEAGGGLCGDVDFEAVKPIAGAITPVPGGVGPMTIAMLLANTLTSAERFAEGTVQ